MKYKNLNKIQKKKNNFFNQFDKNFELFFKEKNLRRFKKFKNIILIGMGGSILGSKAIHTFFENKIKKPSLFLYQSLEILLKFYQ